MKMMNIVTLTLNPAVDVHCRVRDFTPCRENLARIDLTEAGGKGINVSRALTANGVSNTAFAVLGTENAAAFKDTLLADGLSLLCVTVEGRIRENITLHTDNAPETRISFEGFSADDSLLDEVENAVADKIDGNTVVVFGGRAPAGVSLEAVKRMLRRFHATGAKLVIDSRSLGRKDIAELPVWLIKPNEEEIEEYSGEKVSCVEDAIRAAEGIKKDGVENVMVSLGAGGALLCCADGCYVARAPKIEPLSTIGAGDSSIAGFLAAMARGESYDGMLRNAVCFGTAACLTAGTRPPKAEDVSAILPLVVVDKIY